MSAFNRHQGSRICAQYHSRGISIPQTVVVPTTFYVRGIYFLSYSALLPLSLQVGGPGQSIAIDKKWA